MSRKADLAIKQARRDVEALLAVPEFRRFIMRLIDETGVFARSFTGNSETFFREGQRAVGLSLIEQLEAASPGAFSKLQVEAHALRQAQGIGKDEGRDDE